MSAGLKGAGVLRHIAKAPTWSRRGSFASLELTDEAHFARITMACQLLKWWSQGPLNRIKNANLLAIFITHPRPMPRQKNRTGRWRTGPAEAPPQSALGAAMPAR